MKKILLLLSVFYFILFILLKADPTKNDREIITVEREKSMFTLYSILAKATFNVNIKKIPGGQRHHFTTSDEKKLHGYILKSSIPPQGYLLLLQGNAFPADQLVKHFEPIRHLGIDIYIFDYRGYLKSEGKRRVYAMEKDYEEIIADLNTQYEKHFIYGASFGGIVALSSLSSSNNFQNIDLIILDGVPSSLDDLNVVTYRDYNPINKIPLNCNNFYIITSEKDKVIPPQLSKKLIDSIILRNGEAFEFTERGHPFQTETENQKKERISKIKKLLKKRL